MAALSRVVWSEGMHLAQHHFQAQTRYFEELSTFAVRTLFFQPWGLIACELDAEALLNGTASVIHAAGIMPDGLAFSFPDEPAPAPLEVASLFSPTEDAQILQLVIPAYRPSAANAAADGRFEPETVTLPDEVSGEEPRPVRVARKNFRLLLGTAEEGSCALPVARVRRDGSGHFVYDSDYIPPTLRIGASPRLLGLLARLLEVLDSRAAGLRAERQATPSGAGAGFASREISSFWLSHALHSSIPALRGLLEARAAHPEQVYTELLRLAGALCTFSLTSSPRALPLYDPFDLGGCFGALERHIFQHLDVVLPTGGLTLSLRPTQECYYTANVTDARCFQGAHWFLGVRAEGLTPPMLAERVPQLAKICSAKHIERLVREARPALGLDPVASPPAALSPRFDTQYFLIQLAGPCWTLINETREVGVYLPAAIPGAELDLCILLES